MWQEKVKPFVESGSLTVIGVVQEQHRDRARLYTQWRGLDWPIFVDSLNLLDLSVVPVFVAIDASGIVRLQRVRRQNIVKDFIEADFAATPTPDSHNPAAEPDPARLHKRAEELQTPEAWRDYGDACFLANQRIKRASSADPSRGQSESRPSREPARTVERGDTCDPVDAYERAVKLDPTDGRAQFRLGVALRSRYESRRRRPGDAQTAVERWGLALATDPNQYIWRRRIQQYGPRLDKPYDFYSWVEEARTEITARGDTPVALSTEPTGAEMAAPAGRTDQPSRGQSGPRPSREPAQTSDPSRGRNGIPIYREPARTSTRSKACGPASDSVQRDTHRFITIEPVVTPARVRPGHRVRVRVLLQVNRSTRPYWNNEAEDLRVCLELPSGLSLGEGELTHPNPSEAETREDRAVEFELAVDEAVKTGPVPVPAYALYYVCENKGGKCRYLRRDFTVTVEVDPTAPTIQ